MIGSRVVVAISLLALSAGEAHADRALARALVEEGLSLRSAGDTRKALERFEEAIEADSDYLPAYDAAAWMWLGEGKYAAAIKYLGRATLRHPGYAFGWYTLANAYRQTARYDLAVLCYETYISLRPDDPDPYFGLAMAHKKAGDVDEASLALQRYLTLESRPERARFIAAARKELEKLGVEPPPPEVTAAGERLARAERLVRDHRFASALALLSQLGPSTPEQRAELWKLRARAYLGAGRPDRAVSAALVALSSAPEDPAVYEVLARAYRAGGSGAVADYFRRLSPER